MVNAHPTQPRAGFRIASNSMPRPDFSQSRLRTVISKLALLAACLLLAVAIGCDRNAPAPADQHSSESQPAKVRLLLNWYPEAEHGGYYAALRQGYYREAGLEVEIVKGGPQAPVIPQVDQRQMEFGIANADGLVLARAEEATVVALMAPLQTSPRVIMVHAASLIDDFTGLKNLTLAMNPQPFATFLQRHVPLEGVTIVPYQGSVAAFLSDANFAQQGYLFSEPFVAEQQGGDPKSLLVADLGFNPYTSVLFTSESYLHEHEEIVAKMVAASVRGWRHYIDHPEATNEYLHEINPEMSAAALAFGVQALKPLVLTEPGQAIGDMTLDRWQTLIKQLEELDLVKPGAVTAEQALTTRFLRPAGKIR